MSKVTDRFVTNFVEGVADRLFHRPRPVHTDPAVIATWDEWKPPHQWMTEHDGGGVA